MKKQLIYLFLCSFFAISNVAKGQCGGSQIELIFTKISGANYTLKVQCIPVSAIYNDDRQLNLISKGRNNADPKVFFNNGTRTVEQNTETFFTTAGTTDCPGYNEDYLGNNPALRNGNIGAGIYIKFDYGQTIPIHIFHSITRLR